MPVVRDGLEDSVVVKMRLRFLCADHHHLWSEAGKLARVSIK